MEIIILLVWGFLIIAGILSLFIPFMIHKIMKDVESIKKSIVIQPDMPLRR